MPYKPAKPCRVRTCSNTTLSETGYCAVHIYLFVERRKDPRQSSSRRGYDAGWRRVRQEVLDSAGIPRSEHWRYDVDHSPKYDPATEPDHRTYRLTPRLHAEHSRKTARDDGGFGNKG
jgi:hypothetical protein